MREGEEKPSVFAAVAHLPGSQKLQPSATAAGNLSFLPTLTTFPQAGIIITPDQHVHGLDGHPQLTYPAQPAESGNPAMSGKSR